MLRMRKKVDLKNKMELIVAFLILLIIIFLYKSLV